GLAGRGTSALGECVTTHEAVAVCWCEIGLVRAVTSWRSAISSLRSVHDSPGQVMRPGCGVIMRPQTGVNLRNNHLLLRRTQLVDFISQQGSCVQTMGANFDLLAAVPWNQLVGVDRLLQ